MDNGYSRRRFISVSGGLAGGGWLAVNVPLLLAAGRAAADQQAAGAAWINITPVEAEALAAVADQIIPPDDLPGAAEAGVVQFIDQALGGFIAGQAAMLREGLTDLDRRARETPDGNRGFAALPFESQTAILLSIETGPFFNLMIFVVHCGMFAMPSRGGNRNRSGWALLGFDDRHVWQPPFGFYDAEVMAQEQDHAGA